MIPGVLVLSPYQVYLCCLHTRLLVKMAFYSNATTQADMFTLTFRKPDLRIDFQFIKQQDELAEVNRTILQLMITAV